MEFGVLGPLVVEVESRELPLSSAKQRMLLGILLSHANKPVSQRRLMEAMWDVPPASAAENLRLYVYHLRRALDDSDRITRDRSGYSIMVHRGELDAERFDEGAAEGSKALAAGDLTRASGLLTKALSLFRGPAYQGLADTPLIRQAALRLEEARLRVIEDRIAADLKLGRHAELVAELTDLAHNHPYKEGLRAYHMLALYRSGRQAEALDVFRDTRQLLIEQLGIEPGPGLQRLHEAILRGDEAAPDWWSPAEALTAKAPETPGWGPYQGLMAFQPEHHEWFFGRSQLIARLRERIERLPVVGVFGASGSGKSSLLRAGLIGRITTDRRTAGGWRSLLITPTEHPLDALSAQVAILSGIEARHLRQELRDAPNALTRAIKAALPDEARLLLVVDQFEEIFTLCSDEEERGRFVETILHAALSPEGRTKVVLGVRADFVAHFTQQPGLVEALEDEAQLLVGPASSADLREIVVGPAVRAGLRVEPDLLATVLADTTAEPGALPLVSHALLETWRHRSGRTLTLAAYQAIGGVRGAIAQTAERVYDELDREQQQAARRIFLRLSTLGKGREDTRRPIARSELVGVADAAVLTDVLNRLADARLIVLGTGTVEVAHEALIRAWPRLDRWLTEDRANLFVHRRLTDAAHTWRELERDSGALYRGATLLAASSWADDHPQELNQLEGDFLRASRALEDAEANATRRRTRLLNRLVAGMGVLLLLAVLGGGVALQQRQEARHQQLIELSHQLSLKARSLLATDPDVAGLLAVEAFRINPDSETRGAVLSAAAAARRRIELNAGGAPIFDVAFSPDSSQIASAGSDGLVNLWDPVRRSRVATLSEHTAVSPTIYARRVAYSGDGRLLASIGKEPSVTSSAGSVIVWDLQTRKPVLQEREAQLSNAMAFSSDGRTLAVGGGAIVLWDVATRTRRTLGGYKGPVGSLAFSPDGTILVSAGQPGQAVVWDVKKGERITALDAPPVHTVVFGTAGTTIATVSNDHQVRFWRLERGHVTPQSELPGRPPYAWDISAPAGGRIAVADENGLITIWDIRQRQAIESYQDRGRAETRAVALSRDGTMLASAGLGRTIMIRGRAVPAFGGHSQAVNDIEISPSGRVIASAGSDASVRLWDTSGNLLHVLAGHHGHVEAISFSSDGHRLAAITRDHNVSIWDLDRLQRLSTFPYKGLGTSTDIAFQPGTRMLVAAAQGRYRWYIDSASNPAEQPFPDPPTIATVLAFSPDGRLLASAGPSGNILVWDPAKDQALHRLGSGQREVLDIALTPDGKLLATAGADRTVKLWDMRTGKALATLTGHTAPVRVLALSPGGHTLASAGEDRTIIVWDLASRRPAATLTGHSARVQALAYTHDGDLISGGDDNRIIRWSLAPAAAVSRICDGVGRNLTRAEWSTHIPGTTYRATCHR